MSEAYAGKSDQDIIAEQAASMADKENPLTKSSYNPRNTVTSEESNVNESGVEGFPGAEVSIGRTGQTGGGTSAQNIPAEEGGQDRSQTLGESSDRFEGEGDADDKRRERLANNPGGYDSELTRLSFILLLLLLHINASH